MKKIPPFEPTLHIIIEEGEEPMYVINMRDGFAYILGERWQVEKIAHLLNHFLETGETSDEMDYLAEELGFKWLTVKGAHDLAKQLTNQEIPERTIRYAAAKGFIKKAKKAGRDWIFAQARFLAWLNNRPKPGRK